MVFSGYIPSSGNAGSYGSSSVVAVQLLSHVQLFMTVWTVVVLRLLFLKKRLFFLISVALGLCCLFGASLVMGNGLSCPLACRILVFQSGMDPTLEVRF